MTDSQAAFQQLDRLAALLRAEGMPSGPDVWLSVYRLLDRLKQKDNNFPQDVDQFRLVLGPLFCRNPEEQARFKVLFEYWWVTQSDPVGLTSKDEPHNDQFTLAAHNRLASPAHAALHALHVKINKIGRAWLVGVVVLIAILMVALFVWMRQPDPIQPPPVPKPPPSPVLPEQVAQATMTIPIVDHVQPRLQPEPQLFSEDWKQWLPILSGILLLLPWVVALGWILKHYHQQWTLNRQAPSGDDLFNQLHFERVLTPIFGGAQAEQALRDLRAAKIETSNRLDVKATIEATARSGDYFCPVYRQRRIAPEHLLLVRSMHRHDQQAALAEELEKRLLTLGLQVQTYRFRDDPRWLVRWGNHDEKNTGYFRLEQLLARHGTARLFVISETDILFHPYSGEPRSWLQAFSPWQDKVWLYPHDAHSGHAGLLAKNRFLMLPLGRDSLPQLVEHLTAPHQSKPLVVQPVFPLQLPDLIAKEPDSWLEEKPPYGADLSELIKQLEYFLGSYGLRLLRAVAVYPKPHWSLTQALDYLLYGHLNSTQQIVDPPERREQRLARISRLPWLTHAYLPDWLREYLLLGMDREERARITSVWQRLFSQLTDQEGVDTLKLDVRTLSKRQLKIRLNEFRAQSHTTTLNDSIFAHILLGGNFGLLDFRLPRALARLFPQASRSLILRPALMAILLAIVTTAGFHVAWRDYGESALSQFRQNLVTSGNRDWPVSIQYQATTEALATALRDALQHIEFPVETKAADSSTSDFPINRIQYAPGGEAVAERVAQSLRWLTYGAEIDLKESSALSTNTLYVELGQTYQHLGAFNDELRHPYVTKLPFEPEMVRIPPGKFLMGSVDGSDVEKPQHEVTIAYAFEISKYEVTFAEYDHFAKATNRTLPDDRGWGRETRPVINVSFGDAQAYTQWLSQQTGKKYRLPTEAEWEYVARAGAQTAYWWGDDIGNNNAVCAGCGSSWDNQQTAPVGSFKPNAFGLFDTAGNVWEWTQDCWHSNYDSAPKDGSAWLEKSGGDCGIRVVRGGSWGDSPQNLRSAIRYWDISGGAGDNLGFRISRDF